MVVVERGGGRLRELRETERETDSICDDARDGRFVPSTTAGATSTAHKTTRATTNHRPHIHRKRVTRIRSPNTHHPPLQMNQALDPDDSDARCGLRAARKQTAAAAAALAHTTRTTRVRPRDAKAHFEHARALANVAPRRVANEVRLSRVRRPSRGRRRAEAERSCPHTMGGGDDGTRVPFAGGAVCVARVAGRRGARTNSSRRGEDRTAATCRVVCVAFFYCAREVAAYRRCLELDPSHMFARCNLGLATELLAVEQQHLFTQVQFNICCRCEAQISNVLSRHLLPRSAIVVVDLACSSSRRNLTFPIEV